MRRRGDCGRRALTISEHSSFGRLLRRQRLAAGLTQEELAERAHLSVRGISDLERGVNITPRRGTVELLVDALQLTESTRREFEAAARDTFVAVVEGTLLENGSHDVHVPALVGRQAEVDTIRNHLAAGEARVLVFGGEPGIGKSRLLQEEIALAEAGGYTVVQGDCQRRSASEAYAPLPEALMGYLSKRSKAQLKATLQGCAWLVRLLPELTGVTETAVSPEELSSDQERRLMFSAVSRLLGNIAGPAGTLLVLDDLQWAGPDLFDLLSALVATVPMLRIACAYRDTETDAQHPLSVWLADMARLRRVQHRELRPLPQEHAAELLDFLLGEEQDERTSVQETVVQRAGGVPFFLVSYADGLRSGMVGTEAEIPWDLAQGLRQRVNALPEDSREALSAAAVIGRSAALPLVTAVLNWTEDEAIRAFEAARRDGLLVEERDAVYRFRHDVIRDVVDADLGGARRMMLHRRTAEILQQGEGEPPVDLLAYHWSRSGNTEKAIEWLERAGIQAENRYAWVAAEQFYRDLIKRLDGAGKHVAAARVRQRLSMVLWILGRYDEMLVRGMRSCVACVQGRRGQGW